MTLVDRMRAVFGEGAWLIVGNIDGIRGDSSGPGTKHFSHGTKVYVGAWSRGNVESVPVIGRHRGGGRLVCLWMPSNRIVNLRVKFVRDPGVLEKSKTTMAGVFSSAASAQEFLGQIASDKSRRTAHTGLRGTTRSP